MSDELHRRLLSGRTAVTVGALALAALGLGTGAGAAALGDRSDDHGSEGSAHPTVEDRPAQAGVVSPVAAPRPGAHAGGTPGPTTAAVARETVPTPTSSRPTSPPTPTPPPAATPPPAEVVPPAAAAPAPAQEAPRVEREDPPAYRPPAPAPPAPPPPAPAPPRLDITVPLLPIRPQPVVQPTHITFN